jgi:CRISPR/Cas system CSM-associated protein Csm3 (group 7 of RAMP superfamily)
MMVVRTGVGIGRKLGTVREERLFFTEAVPHAAGGDELRFAGEMEVRADRAAIGWLVAAMRLVTHLGGQKGRGLGRVELAVCEVQRWDAGRGWLSLDAARFCEEVVALALPGSAAC